MVTGLVDSLANARRVVIKIGSALLVDHETGRLNAGWLRALVEDVASLKARGADVILVSSGAIALGSRQLGLASPRTRLEAAQAAAAVGQIRLAHAYEDAFAAHDITVAQVLLTIEDMEDRRRYLNARSTVETLLGLDVIPVVNENDTVATAEIRFGDNDRLGARVAQMAGADLLVLLSDIDGLYSADPALDENAEFIADVPDITAEIEAMAGPCATGGVGSGGMITKIQAAHITTAAGCAMAIIGGTASHPLARALDTGRGTLFRATRSAPQARKQWLMGLMAPLGTLTVDDGAADALAHGKSLLPAGIIDVEGSFERGDLVRVEAAGTVIAQGLAGYGSDELLAIKGRQSSEIEAILGVIRGDAALHRNDLTTKVNGS